MQPTRSRRRSTVALAAAVACSVIATFAMAGGAFAASAAEAPGAARAAGGKPTATLKILKPSVSIKRKGSDEFKPAKNGQKLRVGDSVQTDATGFAQVNYTDESLTRLDVSTTFTIVSLTDDAGNRKIKGKVDSGQTWNRTSALTESESFEQEGAGATAAVVGTAFNVQCDAVTGICIFTSVIDGIQLTTVDGEIILMEPLEQCDSTEISETDANLCDEASQLAIDAAIANQWILLNLFLDGLAGFEGIIVVEDGQVVFVSGGPPTGGSTSTTSTTLTEDPPATGPPVIDPVNPVFVVNCNYAYPDGECLGDGGLGASSGSPSPVPNFAAPGLYSPGGADVYFSIKAVVGPSGLPFFVVFVDLPDGDFGVIYADNGFGYGAAVVVGTQYGSNQVFRFEVADVGVDDSYSDTMTVKVVNADGESPPEEIPITIEDDDDCYAGCDE